MADRSATPCRVVPAHCVATRAVLEHCESKRGQKRPLYQLFAAQLRSTWIETRSIANGAILLRRLFGTCSALQISGRVAT